MIRQQIEDELDMYASFERLDRLFEESEIGMMKLLEMTKQLEENVRKEMEKWKI